MTSTKTIVTVAKEIYDNMEYKTRDNGDKYCILKNDIEWQREIIRESHLNRFPSDDVYDRINTILSIICELADDATDDDIREAVYSIEADIYTNDLTKWLNNNNNNVYYLDDAIASACSKDGFQLLAFAQSTYIQEIGHALINAIQEYIDGLE